REPRGRAYQCRLPPCAPERAEGLVAQGGVSPLEGDGGDRREVGPATAAGPVAGGGRGVAGGVPRRRHRKRLLPRPEERGPGIASRTGVVLVPGFPSGGLEALPFPKSRVR